MTPRRAFIIAGLLLIIFLALYSWNRRSGVLDNAAASVGLELSSYVLTPLSAVRDTALDVWNRYFDLVDVREENRALKARVEELEARLLATGEDLAELKRLRELVQFPVDERWRPLAARVLAGRLGPNGVLDSVTISRGYANGSRPGAPLVTNLGLVGRVVRASPSASTALLLTDPGSRVAVFGQESRAPGILKGRGTGRSLEVDFVQRDSSLKEGEVLVTSGLDNKFPKGLPAARVTRVAPSDYTQFMAVDATPLVDLQHLEEVLLLEKNGDFSFADESDDPGSTLVGPPAPSKLTPFQLAPRAPIDSPRAATPSPAPTETPVETASAPEAENSSRASAVPEPEAQTRPRLPEAPKAPRAPAQRQNSPAAAPPRPGSDVPRNAEGAPKYRIITP